MQNHKTIKAKTVKDSKIKFELTVVGEWDFNRDLAGDDRESTILSHSWYMSKNNFQAALQSILAEPIFNGVGGVGTVHLKKLECSPECEVSFQELKARLSEKEKEAAKTELAELERRVEVLKAKTK